MNFEELLNNIEAITKQIESGTIGLDKSIELYDKAMKDCKQCYDLLKNAKGKIEILNEEFKELQLKEKEIEKNPEANENNSASEEN